MLKYITHSCWA